MKDDFNPSTAHLPAAGGLSLLSSKAEFDLQRILLSAEKYLTSHHFWQSCHGRVTYVSSL
jgi:hypothetical protein